MQSREMLSSLRLRFRQVPWQHGRPCTPSGVGDGEVVSGGWRDGRLASDCCVLPFLIPSRREGGERKREGGEREREEFMFSSVWNT